MKPLVVFADPELALVNYLEGRWAGRLEPYKPATLDAGFPDDPLRGDDAWLQVALDGTPTVEYPVRELATIRFTFWTARGKPTNAKDGASLTQGFVATHPGDGDVWSTRILTGRLVAQDDDTGNQAVSFTARITLRPHAP